MTGHGAGVGGLNKCGAILPKLLKSSLAHKIYIDREGCRLGPFTLEEVNKALADGELFLSDQAWTEGMPQWVRLKEFPNVRHPLIPKLKRWLLLLLVGVGWTAGATIIAPKVAYLIADPFTDVHPKSLAEFSDHIGGRLVFFFLEMPLVYWGFQVFHMYKTDSQKREAEEERNLPKTPTPSQLKRAKLIKQILITMIVLMLIALFFVWLTDYDKGYAE